jgi:hypothetical protein
VGSGTRLPLWLGLVGVLAGCEEDAAAVGWETVHEGLPAALLSVWGTSAEDVWAVGGDTLDGAGPMVIHFDGDGWQRVATPQTNGNLWWVFGFEGGPIYAGGDGGVILRSTDGATFEAMLTPGTETVFGIWGASPEDVWAVGGASENMGGFAWRLEGDAWMPEVSVPANVTFEAALWKVYGTASDDAWLVGSNGVSLHWNGVELMEGDTGVGSSLFTVHASEGIYAAVGGLASGIIVEHDGSRWDEVTPDPAPQGLAGVTLGADGHGIAVGTFGTVLSRSDDGWAVEDLGFPLSRNLHGSWIDPEGGVWAVGGDTLTPPFIDGILIHEGPSVPGGDL